MMVNQAKAVSADVYISYIKEMKTDKDLALVRKVTREWEKAAGGKIDYFSKKQEMDKVKVAEDAKEVAGGIRSILADSKAIREKRITYPVYTTDSIKKREFAVYGAYDNRGKIQGVALVNLKGDTDHAVVLDELIVNPERVKSIGKRAPIAGTGTKLVQAVATKILAGKGKKELGLFSLESSKTFYEKLGFQYDHTEFGGSGAYGMCLGENGLKQLCAKV